MLLYWLIFWPIHNVEHETSEKNTVIGLICLSRFRLSEERIHVKILLYSLAPTSVDLLLPQPYPPILCHCSSHCTSFLLKSCTPTLESLPQPSLPILKSWLKTCSPQLMTSHTLNHLVTQLPNPCELLLLLSTYLKPPESVLFWIPRTEHHLISLHMLLTHLMYLSRGKVLCLYI